MEPHHHEHNHRITSLNKAFIIGIVLNISFVIVEFGVGFYYDSLGLLSDAGHNLASVPEYFLSSGSLSEVLSDSEGKGRKLFCQL